MSFGFVQLMLDNAVGHIKPHFECDLFCCFHLTEKGSHIHCEDLLMSLLSSGL